MTRSDDLEYVQNVFPEAAAAAGIVETDSELGWMYAIDEARLMAGETLSADVPEADILRHRTLLDYTALKLLARRLVTKRDGNLKSGGPSFDLSTQLRQVRSMLADALTQVDVFGITVSGGWSSGHINLDFLEPAEDLV
jgi:hypothetical protein